MILLDHVTENESFHGYTVLYCYSLSISPTNFENGLNLRPGKGRQKLKIVAQSVC